MFSEGITWLYGMCSLSLLGMLILQMVPDGSYQKYVKLCLGGIFLLAICRPALSRYSAITGEQISLSSQVVASWWKGTDHSFGKKGSVEEELTSWEQTMEQQQKKRQEEWLEESLEVLAKDYGFACLGYQVRWQDNWPHHLTVWVSRQEDVTGNPSIQEEDGGARLSLSSIEPVELDPILWETTQASGSAWREQNQEKEETIYYEPSELRPLRQAIQQVWQLTEDQIRLYWEREPAG